MVAHVPVLGQAAATLAAWVVDAILRVVTAVAALPGARVWVAPPPALAIIAYDVIAVVAAFALRNNARVAVALLVVGSAGVLATTLRPPDGRLTITMLDVGQGDAIVVRTPRGHTILIDSGGRLERGPGADGRSPAELVGERVVLAYLKRAGIRRVDLLVNTHPHGDHVGGFAPIVRALRVDAIADSGQQYGGRAFNDGLREAAVHRVPVHLARCGDRWGADDGVTLSVLSPCGALFADGKNDVNENSVVTMLAYRDFRMLFMGDAGFAAEQRLLESGADLRADVLKVGHHGSAYSSAPSFVAAVRPQFAVISVGRHNLFGHPATTTLETLGRAGSPPYRTDLCGAIIVDVGMTLRRTTTLHCSPIPSAPSARTRRGPSTRTIASSGCGFRGHVRFDGVGSGVYASDSATAEQNLADAVRPVTPRFYEVTGCAGAQSVSFGGEFDHAAAKVVRARRYDVIANEDRAKQATFDACLFSDRSLEAMDHKNRQRQLAQTCFVQDLKLRHAPVR